MEHLIDLATAHVPLTLTTILFSAFVVVWPTFARWCDDKREEADDEG